MTPDEFRAALDRLGLTQVAAARLMHVAPRAVRYWVAGERDVPGPVVALLECWERSGLPVQ